MKQYFAFIIRSLLILSCGKKDELTRTFNGSLDFFSTNSPTTAITGQNIISNIRCGVYSVSGDIVFQGFTITETSPKQYYISARALYKDWNTQVTMPVIWTIDTTTIIKATSPGTYLLNFYNSAKLFKSDTVHVN